jgi:phosphoglycerate dehydrogenase-like enzyme
MAAPRIAVAPEGVPGWVADAVVEGGGTVVEPPDAEGLIWFGAHRPSDLAPVLADAPGVRWVQLPWAGVEPYLDLLDEERVWTCGKGVYAEPVAEHALTLLQAGLRLLPERVRATTWGRQGGTSLFDGRVTIVGGGGITEALIALLAPYRCEVTVVRRRADPVAGAARVLAADELDDALPGADGVVLALALTPETAGLFDERRLRLMEDHAWLVNVARGAHVVTDDLVAVLADGAIGGAALDVTDPEPLPDGHPLFDQPRCIITPHTANTAAMARPHIAARVRENVRRFGAGEALVGLVDVTLGY